MNSKALRARCIELERPLDLRLFQVMRGADGKFYNEHGEEVTTGDKVKAGVAAASIGAGGAVIGIRGLKKRYGADMATDSTKAGQALTRGVARDVGTAATAVQTGAQDALAKVRSVLADGKNRAAASFRATAAPTSGAPALGLGKRIVKAGKAGLRAVGMRFDARARLIELAAK